LAGEVEISSQIVKADACHAGIAKRNVGLSFYESKTEYNGLRAAVLFSAVEEAAGLWNPGGWPNAGRTQQSQTSSSLPRNTGLTGGAQNLCER
jgi:hypothetical protein